MGGRSVAQVLWVAFLAAVLVYVAVAYMFPVGPSDLPVKALMMALWASCAVFLVAAVWIYRRLLGPDLVRKYSSDPLRRRGVSPDTPEGRGFFRRSAERWVLRVHLISWTVAEAIAILGLVAALISARPGAVLPFAVAAVLILIRLRPNFSIVDALVPYNNPQV